MSLECFKVLIIITVLSFHVQADDGNCRTKFENLLTTESEKYLAKRHPFIFEMFGLNCDDTPFGNNLINTGAVIFIHEAAHFEDLGWSDDDLTEEIDFNLYTVKNEHIGSYIGHKQLPSPIELISPYIKKNRSEFLLEDSLYHHMHEAYILTESTLSSSTLEGLATELNAYTHGVAIQKRTSKMIPQDIIILDENGEDMSFLNPLHGYISQLEGLMFFVYNKNLYLQLLKHQHPEEWKEFYNLHNQNFMSRMLEASVETLKKIDHCNKRETDPTLNFYIKELKKMDLSILKEILGSKRLETLLCLNEEINLDEIQNVNTKVQKILNSSEVVKQCD